MLCEVIQIGADKAPVEDPNSSVDAADIVEFMWTVVEEEFIEDGSCDGLAVVFEIKTSSIFVVVSKLMCDAPDEEPIPAAVVVDDELAPTKVLVLELVSSFMLDVSPKEGVASDEEPKDSIPAAVDDNDELTPREDVLVLSIFSVIKLEVLELVSSFKLELTLF